LPAGFADTVTALVWRVTCRTGLNGTPIFLISYYRSEAEGIITTAPAAAAAHYFFLEEVKGKDYFNG
jgi:hypothetical protein